MACLITTPAFSTSFLLRPVVTQTFSAGRVGKAPPFPSKLAETGNDFNLVMRTPFDKACEKGH